MIEIHDVYFGRYVCCFLWSFDRSDIYVITRIEPLVPYRTCAIEKMIASDRPRMASLRINIAHYYFYDREHKNIHSVEIRRTLPTISRITELDI